MLLNILEAGIKYFLTLFFEGAIGQSWPPVEFILKTNRGQHIT